MDIQYWVVGAMWSGSEDVLPTFKLRGYWYCWDEEHSENAPEGKGNSVAIQRERLEKIKPGDRIAVKKLLGQGQKEMEIRAIGIVKDIDTKEWRVYVDWLELDTLPRRAPLHGCTASIHGPFKFDGEDKDWVHKVFCV